MSEKYLPNALSAAVQVVDRWHLLKNMGDALQKLLERKRQQITAMQSGEAVQLLEKDQQQSELTKQEDNLLHKHQLLQQVVKMYAAGKSTKTIARILRISINTAKRYIHRTSLHRRQKSKRLI